MTRLRAVGVESADEAWNMDELASDTEHLESLGFTAFGGHDGTDG